MSKRASIVMMAAVSIAGLGLASGTAFAQLSGANRDAFVESSISSCTSTIQQNSPGVPAAAITSYCTCMANKEADMTTPDDVAYMSEHHAATPDYTQRVQNLAPACKAAAGLQ